MNHNKRLVQWILGFITGLVVPASFFVVGGFLFLEFPPDGVGLGHLPYLIMFDTIIALALSFRVYFSLKKMDHSLTPGYLIGVIVSCVAGSLILISI